ncbi:hypothetical protein LBMAG53_33740 [Planctomycetota bacterium]|nr:hypothetical protein LBMAG53_33740 [Planctomycetota bacterium]
MSDRGFTLIELLIVMAVIVVLSGLSLGAYGVLMENSRTSSTRVLLNTMATQMVMYGSPAVIDGADSGGPRLRRLWDFDGDHQVDGDPATFALQADVAAAARCGYRGPVKQLNLQISKSQLDPSGRPVDGWNRPLQIAFALQAYGAAGFGLFSLGADGRPGTDDDLTSWGNR